MRVIVPVVLRLVRKCGQGALGSITSTFFPTIPCLRTLLTCSSQCESGKARAARGPNDWGHQVEQRGERHVTSQPRRAVEIEACSRSDDGSPKSGLVETDKLRSWGLTPWGFGQRYRR